MELVSDLLTMARKVAILVDEGRGRPRLVRQLSPMLRSAETVAPNGSVRRAGSTLHARVGKGFLGIRSNSRPNLAASANAGAAFFVLVTIDYRPC